MQTDLYTHVRYKSPSLIPSEIFIVTNFLAIVCAKQNRQTAGGMCRLTVDLERKQEGQSETEINHFLREEIVVQ